MEIIEQDVNFRYTDSGKINTNDNEYLTNRGGDVGRSKSTQFLDT